MTETKRKYGDDRELRPIDTGALTCLTIRCAVLLSVAYGQSDRAEWAMVAPMILPRSVAPKPKSVNRTASVRRGPFSTASGFR
jgi:hypothetical protein